MSASAMTRSTRRVDHLGLKMPDEGEVGVHHVRGKTGLVHDLLTVKAPRRWAVLL